jgi:GDP-L-fucose synthase
MTATPSEGIRKSNENNVLEVMGDGSAIRDFIYCDDVARGMITAVEKKITEPINLGSGQGKSIKELVQLVMNNSTKENTLSWSNLTGIKGDDVRLFDTKRAESYGIKPIVSLEDGIRITT